WAAAANRDFQMRYGCDAVTADLSAKGDRPRKNEAPTATSGPFSLELAPLPPSSSGLTRGSSHAASSTVHASREDNPILGSSPRITAERGVEADGKERSRTRGETALLHHRELPAVEHAQHLGQIAAAFQHMAALADHRPLALFQAQGGAFLDAIDGR